MNFNLTTVCRFVPEKILAGMQWASVLPRDWMYASLDDDIAINHARLVTFYKELIKNNTLENNEIQFSNIPIVCIYSYQDKDVPSRDKRSKWYMPIANYPGKTWPTYCRGGMYTTTSDMVKKLYQVSRSTHRLYLDDVWITGFMRMKVNRSESLIVVNITDTLFFFRLLPIRGCYSAKVFFISHDRLRLA